ncbi:MAG: sensor histidine kinase [Thermoleophilia bacterium]
MVVFSVGVFAFYNRNADADFEYQGEDNQQEAALQQQVADADRHRLLLALAVVDSGTLAVSMVLGWFLAGRTLAPIQEAMDRQKQFASDAAHELSTPLSVMKAGLETIEAGARPTLEDYRELKNDLLEETNRLVGLAGNLLFLSRSDSSSPAAVYSLLDVSAVCSSVLELLDSYACQKGVRLTGNIMPGLRIAGDESQIKRLVLNLLKNAVDYNTKEGEARLSLQASGGEVVMDIVDTGIGIDEQDLPHVFNRFFKADSARARSSSGNGLGLSIVKEIVAAHKGQIKIESRLGEGTRVVVTFNRR